MLQVFRHARRAVAGEEGRAVVNARWTQRASAGPGAPDLARTEDSIGHGSTARVVTELCGVAARSRPLRFGFIGGGVMAEAMLSGWLTKGHVAARNVLVADVCPASRARFAAKGVAVSQNNADAACFGDVLFLAVKPGMVPPVLRDVSPVVDASKLVVSIAAGVTSAQISTALEGHRRPVRVVRVMPNTACQVGETAAALCTGAQATPEDAALTMALFKSLGDCVQVTECQMDAVTGLAGSGPAFVFMAIEALADGGVRAGLPRALAMQLACQVVKGSASMVTSTGQHPGALKDAVCSPGGTTIAGVHALERSGFRASLMDAVVLATERSAQLAAKTA